MSLNWIAPRQHLLSQLPSGSVPMGHGIKLYISMQDRYDGQKHYVHGLNARERLVNVIAQLVQPGDTVIDIGANIGYFSAIASLRVGAKGKVFAVEASPRMLPRLGVVVEHNPHRNVELVPFAAADTGA
jgi:protein-L-isoaspartate O-methyltransferase